MNVELSNDWLHSSLCSVCKQDSDTIPDQQEVREIVKDYLNRTRNTTPTGDDFRLPEAYQLCDKLYRDTFEKVSEFVIAAGDDPGVVDKLTASACDTTGTAYMHASAEHQQYIALYTACVLYADDLGSRHVEALGEFSRRFASGEEQLNPALQVFAGLLKQAHDLGEIATYATER